MAARAMMRQEKRERLQQRAKKFLSWDFIVRQLIPLAPELLQTIDQSDWTGEIVRSKGTGRLTMRYAFKNGVIIYAKAYTDDLGLSSYEALRYLWQNGFGRDRPHQVPEPLGFISEENFMSMRRADGAPLASMLTEKPTEEIAPCVRAAARWLAELHSTDMPSIQVEPPCERIKIFKLADMMAKAAAAYPQQTPLLLNLLQKIRKLAPAWNSPPKLTPTHGQYTPANVFLQSRRVVVIDLDRICLSDPAKDVAMFVHRVKSLLFKASGDSRKAEQIASEFVDEYRTRAEENLVNLSYYRALYSLKGFAKFAKDRPPGDPARAPVEEFYLGEFERCMNVRGST